MLANVSSLINDHQRYFGIPPRNITRFSHCGMRKPKIKRVCISNEADSRLTSINFCQRKLLQMTLCCKTPKNTHPYTTTGTTYYTTGMSIYSRKVLEGIGCSSLLLCMRSHVMGSMLGRFRDPGY